jgi:hypothetical protein
VASPFKAAEEFASTTIPSTVLPLMDVPSRLTRALFSTTTPLAPPVTVMWLIATRCAPLTVITLAFGAVTTAEPLPSSVRPLVVMLTAPVHVPKTLSVVCSSADMTALARDAPLEQSTTITCFVAWAGEEAESASITTASVRM